MQNNLIYKLTNKINGKSYIGRTKNLKKRILSHQSRSRCRIISAAIKKYGIKNFEIAILEENLDLDTAIKRESELIISEKSLSPHGYNLTTENRGGGGRLSEETIRKTSNSAQKKSQKQNITGFIGVKKVRGIFLVRTVFYKKVYGRYFKNIIEAAEAYDKINLHLRGIECRLNFPKKLNNYLNEDLSMFFKWFCNKRKKTSRFKGVSYDKNLKRWRSFFCKNGKTIRLGCFSTEDDARNALEEYNNESDKMGNLTVPWDWNGEASEYTK
jgi:group I intron endonuclease